MDDIQLNFICKTNDTGPKSVVILQKNSAQTYDEVAVAWRVIHCDMADHYSFKYSKDISISIQTLSGHCIQEQIIDEGHIYKVIQDPKGNPVLIKDRNASSDAGFTLINDIPEEQIRASIFRDQKLLAISNQITYKQITPFDFPPALYLGVAIDIIEGEIVSSAVLNTINTKLSLFGIKRADIVMYGGGTGRYAEPYRFEIENISRE